MPLFGKCRRAPGAFRPAPLVGVGVVVLLAGLGGGRAASAQTVYGPKGLFVHPTAYLQPKGAYDINFSFLQVDPGGGARVNNWIPLSLTYGVNEKFHLGATYLARRYNGQTGDSYGAFFRGLLSDGARDGTRVAVNLSFLGGDVKQGAVQVVASRVIAPGARRGPVVGHAGLQMVGRGDIPGKDTETALGAFVGLEVPLSPALRVVAEGGTKLSFDKRPASSVGVMYTLPRGTSIGLGYVNAGRSRTNQFFFGIGFPIGEGRTKPGQDGTGTPPTRGAGFPLGEGE